MQINRNKILIIDDSILAIKALEHILKDIYEVISARGGEEGIAIAKEQKPDLILLDIEMPKMNGFEVLKILKECHETAATPIIFLTGFMDAEYEERGFLMGAVDYIVKPYNNNVVKARVMTHINLSKYRKQLERQLKVDMLTGLYNRRGLDEYLFEAAQEAVKKEYPLNCVIVDIDYFKKVNDTYGHLEGDRVLLHVGSLLTACLTPGGGYVARYGGEEFAVVLPKADEIEIRLLMEQTCKKIHQAKIPNEKSDISPYLTVSAGGAGWILKEPREAKELLKTADEMLYHSKENGRNRFTWYQPN